MTNDAPGHTDLMVTPESLPAYFDKQQFCERFVARMVKTAGFERFKSEDGTEGQLVAEYAAEVAPTYFDDDTLKDLSPEDCADADMSYWGE